MCNGISFFEHILCSTLKLPYNEFNQKSILCSQQREILAHDEFKFFFSEY